MKRTLILTIYCLLSIYQYGQQPSTALKDYLQNDDNTYAWEIKEMADFVDCKAYTIFLISQKWQGLLWKHELIVYVPKEIAHDGAMLFISGGGVDENRMPKFSKKEDGLGKVLSMMAIANKAPIAILNQVPLQPLYGGLTEDALIAYTLNEFKKSGDYSWPLLFPMVKSASKAMDVVQELVKKESKKEINRFLVTGASKRGWTTWLTAASEDPRVEAIAPMVIEMLNMPKYFDSQLVAYGEYSEQIIDYVKLEIPQAVNSEFGKAVVQMIDPYSYFDKISIPKLIIMATNDPYWTVDAIQNYIHAIPGEYLLHYTPNAGHNLGDKKQALEALNAFFSNTLNKEKYPLCSWKPNQKKKIELEVNYTSAKLVGASLWQANAETRDLRLAKWLNKEISLKKDSDKLKVKIDYPKIGFTSFYVELVYESSLGSTYSVCTSAYVADKKQVFIK